MTDNTEWLPENADQAPDPRVTDNGWHPGDPETELDQSPVADLDEDEED